MYVVPNQTFEYLLCGLSALYTRGDCWMHRNTHILKRERECQPVRQKMASFRPTNNAVIGQMGRRLSGL
jgi:hypothetical protein